MKYLKTLEKLVEKKGLKLSSFTDAKGTISLDDDFAIHAAWAFEHIFSLLQVGHLGPKSEVARPFHGIQHVTRAAEIYGVVFTNLFRRHKHPEALKLTPTKLKLIKLALLFHDAGRENENEDLWDHDSGLLLYFYLTLVLGCSHETAKLMAEAIANKDQSPHGYRELVENNGELTWVYTAARPKNILEIIIHDADCLDIIRARDSFDATYLDFFEQIVEQSQKMPPDNVNQQAFKEMTKLRIEATSFIELQGDGRRTQNMEIKKRYENKNVVSQLQATLDKTLHPLLISLYADGKLLDGEQLQKPLWEEKTYDPSKGVTAENLDALLLNDQPYMLIRGIGTPSSIDKKKPENFAHLEVRKTKRTPDLTPNERYTILNVAEIKDVDLTTLQDNTIILSGKGACRTASLFRKKPLIVDAKPDVSQKVSLTSEQYDFFNKQTGLILRDKSNSQILDGFINVALRSIRKNGNINRSTTLIGYGASVYTPVGFIVVDPDVAEMNDISSIDAETNRGKKNQAPSKLSVQEKQTKVQEVQRKQKMGGSSRRFDQYGYTDTHNEITIRIKAMDAVYYTNDPTTFNYISHRKFSPYHPHAPYLQALFLHNEHARLTGRHLPIVEYSGVHNYIRPSSPWNPDTILAMWRDLVRDYLDKSLVSGISSEKFLTMSLDDLKAEALYGAIDNPLAKRNASADSNYPENLKVEINKVIAELRVVMINDFPAKLLKQFKAKPASVISDEIFFHLLHFPSLRKELKVEIKAELEKIFSDDSWHKTLVDNLHEFRFDELKDCASKDKLERGLYFYRILRLYALAKLANDQKRIDLIKAKIRTTITSNLGNFGTPYTSGTEGILGFAIFCDLYGEYKNVLNQKIAAILASYENKDKNSTNIYNLQLFVRKLESAGLLNRNMIKQVRHIVQLYKEVLSRPNQFVQNEKDIKDRIGHIEKILSNSNHVSFRFGASWLKIDLIDPLDFLSPTKSKEQNLPIIAAHNGRVDLIEKLSQAGADLGQVSHDAWTAAHAAIEANSAEVLEKLIVCKVDINLSKNDGLTPVAMAVDRGYLPLFKILTGVIKDLNKNESSNLLVEIAAQKDRADFIPLFAEAKINLNQIGKDGLTPVMHATKFGYVNTVEAFRQAGVSLEQSNSEGETLLYLATQQGNKAMVEYFIQQKVNLNKAAKSGKTAVVIALELRQYEILAILLKAGAESKAYGEPLIHYAVKQGNLYCYGLSTVIQASDDVDVLNSNGQTALEVLVRHDVYIPEELWNRANLNKQNPDGDTVLHIVVRNAIVRDMWVKKLFPRNPKSLQNKEGNTPLHVALQHLRLQNLLHILDALLNIETDINRTNVNGDTPLHLIFHIKNKANYWDDYSKLAIITKQFIQKGADVNKPNLAGDTPFHLALMNSEEEIVKQFLLEAKVDLAKTNSAGQTPKEIAAEKGNPWIQKYLAVYEVRFSSLYKNIGFLSADSNEKTKMEQEFAKIRYPSNW